MGQPEEITELIRDVSEKLGVIADYFKDANMTSDKIRLDTKIAQDNLFQLREEAKNVDTRNQEASLEHDKIIAMAKEEADKILARAREKLVSASHKEEESNKLLAEMKDKKYIHDKTAVKA